MNFSGIIVGLATFLIIGVCHPIVIKAEYHFGKKCWWAFLVVGIIFAALSILTPGIVGSTILGVISFSSLWGIREIFEQEKRVAKGWFPENPKKKKK